MFGSSAGLPYWHQATASSPSKTTAAWARPSPTSRCLRARLPSAVKVLSACSVWKKVHQQPPKTPLCRSMSRAYASHVSESRALTAYSATAHFLPVVGGLHVTLDVEAADH